MSVIAAYYTSNVNKLLGSSRRRRRLPLLYLRCPLAPLLKPLHALGVLQLARCSRVGLALLGIPLHTWEGGRGAMRDEEEAGSRKIRPTMSRRSPLLSGHADQWMDATKCLE